MHRTCKFGKMNGVRPNSLGVSALALLMVMGSAHAQTQTSQAPASSGKQNVSADGDAEQVVVTATRRGEENVQNIPISVQAYSGSTLEKLGVQSMEDLGKVDPALSIQTFGVNQEQVIIRGVSSTTGQTAGIYVDETPLEGGFNANLLGDNTPELRLHDLDHVEVLTGPQGTLFGAGSMSGTVRVITNQPDLEDYSGSIEARAGGVQGGDGYFDGNAVLNVPVIKDQLGLRFVAWGENGGGYIDQTIGSTTRDDVNDEHLYGGRVEALWKPTSDFSVRTSVNYQNTTVDGAQSWTPYVGPLTAPGGPETGPYPAYENHAPTQEPYSSDYTLASLTAQYDLGFGQIIATSGYGRKNELNYIDTTAQVCSYDLCAGSPAYPASFTAHSAFTDFTNEIRFSSDFKGPFQFVSGFYSEQDSMQYDGAVINGNVNSGALPCNTYAACAGDGLMRPGFGNNPIEFANQDNLSVDQYAFYGQANYEIVPSLTATIGIRYFMASLNDQQTTQQNIAPTTTPYGFDGGYVLGDVTRPYVSSVGTAEESKTTYNYALLWQASDEISFYARAASGFRIGGINEAATVASQEGVAVPTAYQPDSLWDYEGGVKLRLMDGRLTVNATGYHIDWNGQQEDALAAGIYNYTLNVGKTEINGVALDTSYRPIEVPGLTLGGSFTYVDSTLGSDLPANVVSAGTPGKSGDRSPFVPRLNISGQASYTRPVFNDVDGYVTTSLNYRSDSYTAFEASTPAEIAEGENDYYTRLRPYILVNLSAGVRFDDYDVGVYVQNLTNTLAEVGTSSNLNGQNVYTAPPRTIGVHVTAHF